MNSSAVASIDTVTDLYSALPLCDRGKRFSQKCSHHHSGCSSATCALPRSQGDWHQHKLHMGDSQAASKTE